MYDSRSIGQSLTNRPFLRCKRDTNDVLRREFIQDADYVGVLPTRCFEDPLHFLALAARLNGSYSLKGK